MLVKKILASLMVGGALMFTASAVSDIPMNCVGEAGYVKTYDGAWIIEVDDSSVVMIGNNHAHVGIRVKNLIPGRLNYDPYTIIDVMWGKGVSCKYLNSEEKVRDDIALAIGNYMNDNY